MLLCGKKRGEKDMEREYLLLKVTTTDIIMYLSFPKEKKWHWYCMFLPFNPFIGPFIEIDFADKRQYNIFV